ncbi:MAG: PAS domain S-box protein [Lentisphaerae bacterium]|nr:PAS domain S-box protein [Lentisphaerota bacterium]
MKISKLDRGPLLLRVWRVREWRALVVSLLLAFCVTLVGVAINFNEFLMTFFKPHANQPVVVSIINFLVLWLIIMLVTSYLSWRSEALRNEDLEDIIDSINPDVMLVVDARHNIIMVNPAVSRMFGYEVNEVIKRNTELLFFDRRQVPEAKHEIYDALEKEGFHIGWATGRRKDGETFPVEFITGLLKGHRGGVLLVRDVTQRKKAEMEREQLQIQLHQAQKIESVGRLAGGVAHDFNNMLQIILGHTDLAMEQIEAGTPLHADLMEVRNAAQRSAELTRQLLTFARKQVVAPKVININDTIETMLKMLRRLIGAEINLAWLPGNEVWPVKMDPSQIDEILANLCVNARDAIVGVGKITIETAKASFDEESCTQYAGFVPGDYVLLTVGDTGCGMDAETRAHLFEPFFSTKDINPTFPIRHTFRPNGESRVNKGTGLGLASVYGAVKQNNGFIYVNSEPGQGTTFKIYLPRHTTQAAQETEKPEQAAQETEKSEPPTVARRNETILLVEDDPIILESTKKMLENLGYTVVAAATPGEAMRLAWEHVGYIDLLMTDVVMPEMNGRVLSNKLLSLYPSLKILFMSGYTEDVIAGSHVLDEGEHFIQKPFSMNDLGAKTREAMEDECRVA